MTDFNLPFITQSTAVEEAAQKALSLIEKYSELDPRNNDESNPWRNPEGIYAALDEARNELTAAWSTLKEAIEEGNSETNQVNEEDFRTAYINMITDSFSDVLEDLRTGDADFDVDVLVDCLQSGVDLMNQEDRELFMQEMDNDDDEEENDDSKLTPHELRRRLLGFHHLEAAA